MSEMSARPTADDLVGYRIVSTPNGKSYGVNGHIPCDHVAVFEHTDCTRTFDGREWRVIPRAAEGEAQGH